MSTPMDDAPPVPPISIVGTEVDVPTNTSDIGLAPIANDASVNDSLAPKMIKPEVSAELVGQLEAMGFSSNRVVRALYFTGSRGIEQAISWLDQHQGNSVMDTPLLVPANDGKKGEKAAVITRSWKCVETGRLFKSMKALELYAERTGKNNFEESTEEVKPLTEEERKAKKEELIVKLKKRALQKARAEAKAKIEREKARRLAGKASRTMAEEGMRLKRQRDAELRKKEKIETARALARAKKLWAIQEAEKAAARALARGEKPDAARAAAAIAGKTVKRNIEPPMVRIKAAIKVLSTYTAGGEGLRAIKLIRIYLRNALTKDENDPKFRRINLANKHWVARVKGLRGGGALLSATGFVREDACEQWPQGSYFLALPMNRDLLREAMEAIDAAIKAAS